MSHSLSLANSPRSDNGSWSTALAALLSLLLVRSAPAEKIPAPTKEVGRVSASTAVEERLRRDIRYLASDELEGRGVGGRGIDRAAEYLREQLRRAGLQSGVPDGSYYQHFEMSAGCALGKPNELAFQLRATPGGTAAPPASLRPRMGEDAIPLSFGGEGAFHGPLVFAGYGITAREPEGSYDDYSEIDAKGKVVLVIRREPHGKPHGLFGGKGLTRHADLRAKASNAVRHGAAAVLFVSDADSAGATDPLLSFGYGGCESTGKIPFFHVARRRADPILRAALGQDLASLERQIDADLKPRSRVLEGWSAEGKVSIDHRMVPVQNVVGVLPGQGPHADETIVIGAHYDHLGHGGMGSLAPGSKEIHHGADDNASGSAAVLELARRLARLPAPPARRLVFILFTGEESGLIGSAYYVKHPLFPLEQTVAMLNFDMVGRLKEDAVTIFGVRTAQTFPALVDRFSSESHFKVHPHADGFGPSDQTSFYARDIPVLFFFTGNHSDYHRPSDTWDKINYAGEARVIEMARGIIGELLGAGPPPVFVKVPPPKHSDVAVSENMPRLGIIPDYSDDIKGVRLQGVGPASPAERYGLRAGDTITAFDGKPVQNIYDYTYALQSHKAGDKVPITISRQGKPATVVVVLGKPTEGGAHGK